MVSNDPVKRLAHQLVAEFFGSKVAKVMANLLIPSEKSPFHITMPISTTFPQSGGCRSCQHKDQDPGPTGHLHTFVLQSGGLSPAPSYLSIFINHYHSHFLEVTSTRMCFFDVRWELPFAHPQLIPHFHIYPSHPHLFTTSSTGLMMSFTLVIFLLGKSCSWCACLAGSGDDLFKCQKATHCGLHNPGMDTGIISFSLTKI